jgi:membrane-anchored glycerophosphoryl diester phosphodiesterase (GDPDase)
MGGTYAMSSAITWTLIISGINAFVFIATLFAVPLVVLEKKTLSTAVTGSVMLMKKVMGEAMICFFLLILVVSATAATSLLFQIVYGIVAPGMLLIYYPGEAWIAAAILFMLALCGLACVVSTIAGIAITDLYRFGTNGKIAREPETSGATAAELTSFQENIL